MTSAPRELAKLGFTAPDGKATTIESALGETFADALLVMHRGTLIHEWYGDGMSATTPHLICSISKAIAGTLGGVPTLGWVAVGAVGLGILGLLLYAVTRTKKK